MGFFNDPITFACISIAACLMLVYNSGWFQRFFFGCPPYYYHNGHCMAFMTCVSSNMTFQKHMQRYLRQALAGDLSFGRPPVQIDILGGRLLEFNDLSAWYLADHARGWKDLHDPYDGSRDGDRDRFWSWMLDDVKETLGLREGERVFKVNHGGPFELLPDIEAILKHAKESFFEHGKIRFFATASPTFNPLCHTLEKLVESGEVPRFSEDLVGRPLA